MTGTDGLFEVRVEVKSNIFRIFAFFDKGNLVVLGNDFQKKYLKITQSGNLVSSTGHLGKVICK